MAEGAAERGDGPASTLPGTPDAADPAWLPERRTTVPAPPRDALPRDALVRRCMPLCRRLTLLVAPGGFGKTALLAACARALGGRGVPVAWLVLDAGDDEASLDAGLARAFRCAGVAAGAGGGVRAQLRATESLGRDLVLVLDEADALADPAALALLDLVVAEAPANVHIAIACRALPTGLDVSMPVLDGQAEMLTAEDLRFTGAEMAAFLGETVPAAELDELESALAGWPIAVRLHRDAHAAGGGRREAMHEVAGSWVESRLWRTFSPAERDLLLDVGLFEWFDEQLLGEALGEPRTMRRLLALPGVPDLLQRAPGGPAESLRLHPMLRDHCVRRRWRGQPPRYRRLCRRIAGALARRGFTVAAMRHAREAEDGELAASILVRAGGVGLLLREGTEAIVAADRCLPDALAAMPPRAVLVRSLALAASGRLAEARRALHAVPGGPAAKADGTPGLRAERCLTRGVLAGFGCESAPTPETTSMIAEALALHRAPGLDPALRGGLEMILGASLDLHGRPQGASRRAERARRLLRHAPYAGVFLDFQRGQIAMAQGRLADAMALYRSGLRGARQIYPQEPGLAQTAEVLLREVIHERHPGSYPGGAWRPPAPAAFAADLGARFAACDLTAELALEESAARALAAVDEMRAGARDADLTALERHLAAWHAGLLASTGRPAEAERAWAAGGLPASGDDCVDLSAQSWREVESLGCARLRLLLAGGKHDAAAGVGAALLEVAAGAGLRRLEMRALALCLRMACEDGAPADARNHLERFLDLYAESDFARPIARQGDAVAATLARYVDDAPPGSRREAGRKLLAALRSRRQGPAAGFSPREMEILGRLGVLRDKDIAADLELTVDGVRYHVRKIFAKLGTHTRHEAVRQARSLGILPAD